MGVTVCICSLCVSLYSSVCAYVFGGDGFFTYTPQEGAYYYG